MLASVDSKDRVPKNHPLQIIKTVTYEDLGHLSPEFDRMYSKVGRASVPPGATAEGIAAISPVLGTQERAFCNELEGTTCQVCWGGASLERGNPVYFHHYASSDHGTSLLNRASIGCRQIPWGVWFAPGSYGFVLRAPLIGARQGSKTVRDVIRIGSPHRDVPATHRVRRAVLRDHAGRSEEHLPRAVRCVSKSPG